MRDGVELTNLDQPLFDGDDATKRDLVDYLDAVADRIVPVLAGPAAVGDPGPARPAAVHAEERAEVHPGLGAHDRRVGRGVPPRDPLRAVRRPAHAAVVRQPAGRRVPPDAGPGRRSRTRPTWCSTSTRRRAASFRGGRRQPRAGAPGAGRRRAGGRGEDQRRQGCAHLRAAGRDGVEEDAAAATRAIAARAERLDPAIATTAYIVEDREGKVFLDSTRAGGATVVAAYSPRLRPGVPVSFPLAWDELDGVDAGRLHHPERRVPAG